MPDSDLSKVIADNAAGPKRFTTDSTSAEAHSLSEQIEADKYLSAKRAAARKNAGIVYSQVVPRRTA